MGIHPQRDENNMVVRYKARLVAQGFSLGSDIDYDEILKDI
jgi:hypothetical protein